MRGNRKRRGLPPEWNPSQDTINQNNYQLYLLEWVNYKEKDPGIGFSLYGHIVYLADNGEVVYSSEVCLDEKARDFTDLSYGEQFDKGRPNQCTFALPDNCQQILGITLCKEPGDGDDDNDGDDEGEGDGGKDDASDNPTTGGRSRFLLIGAAVLLAIGAAGATFKYAYAKRNRFF